MNRGYVDYSMSVRASEAYSNGQKPKSKWLKREFLKSTKEYLNSECEQSCLQMPLNEIIVSLKSLTIKELKEHFLAYCGYHHTSKFFNETDFYEIDFQKIKNPRLERSGVFSYLQIRGLPSFNLS